MKTPNHKKNKPPWTKQKYCMYCGEIFTKVNPMHIKCKKCSSTCVYCGKEISKQKDHKGFCICLVCTNKIISKRRDAVEIDTDPFEARKLIKKKIGFGSFQKKVIKILEKHFEIIKLYEIGRFLIDVYIKKLDLYLNIITPGIKSIDKDNKENVFKFFKEYQESFFREHGKKLLYIYTTDLIKMREQDLVDFIYSIGNSQQKSKGELFN